MNQYIYLNNNNFYKIIAGIDQHFRMLSLKQKGRSPGAIYSDSAGNQWLGKFAKDREDISGARQIIQEAFGYALYQTFKVDVPPWQLVKAVDKSAGETWWILTKWLSDFKTFEGELFSQMMLSKKPPITIKNMFRGLAIAKFFSEPDCLGGDGDNAGYIEKNEGPA
ncbi:MAG: hypothetical protein VW397_06080, partial [Candidatus Margulisiibacteriota bacterium]